MLISKTICADTIHTYTNIRLGIKSSLDLWELDCPSISEMCRQLPIIQRRLWDALPGGEYDFGPSR